MQETEMDFESRIVTSDFTPEDNDIENSLRPKVLDDYIGQDKVKENLAVYIQAARGRGEALDHVLLYGPPGLGKTTLAGVIANEMGVNLRVTSGPAIEKQGDLAALLTNLQEGDVLFIDEIHRLNRQVEEVLYPAMEDGALDIIIGKGPSARSIRLDLPHFTLIGATTRAGQLSTICKKASTIPHLSQPVQCRAQLCKHRRAGDRRLRLSVLQDHDGVLRILGRVKPCEPQVLALFPFGRELPGLGGTGLARRPAGQAGSILCCALGHRLLQHGAQSRGGLLREHPFCLRAGKG